MLQKTLKSETFWNWAIWFPLAILTLIMLVRFPELNKWYIFWPLGLIIAIIPRLFQKRLANCAAQLCVETESGGGTSEPATKVEKDRDRNA